MEAEEVDDIYNQGFDDGYAEGVNEGFDRAWHLVYNSLSTGYDLDRLLILQELFKKEKKMAIFGRKK